MRVAYLIRHATYDRLGSRLVGRNASLGLNAEGRAQAEALAEALSRIGLDAVLTSPLARCVETARPMAACSGAPLEPVEALNEIDFGEWTGRRFDELQADPAWRAWNAFRGSARCPGGESMLEAQARIVRVLERLPDGRTALVSHGDVIKAALCWALGLSLDSVLRFEIAPASLSAVEFGAGAPRVLWINRSC